MRTILVLVLLICCIRINNGQEKRRRVVNVDTDLDIKNVDKILHTLKAYGERKRPSSVPKTINQFTSTTVVAEEEVSNLQWLTNDKFPETFTKQNRRIRVQYNTKKNDDHGEKIVLEKYLERLIREMQHDSTENSHNTYPIVIMYSYNIPCSIENHMCAEKLHQDKVKRIGTEFEYSMIVGFSWFFDFRGNKERDMKNRQDSFAKLTAQRIQVVKQYNMYEDIQFMPLVLQEKHISDRVAFQTIIFDCLIKQPVVFNCIAVDPQDIDQEQVSWIVAFSVNSMFYDCREFACNYRNTGVWDDSDLQKCLNNWITENIGNDCLRYGTGEQVWKFLLAETINKQGRKMATYIAKPFGLWSEELRTTQGLITPDEYLRSRSNFLCKDTPSYQGWFCTKTRVTNEGSEGSRYPSPPGSPPRKVSKMEGIEIFRYLPGSSKTRDLL